ncbi:MAG: nicotinate-nucleotide adenylyltransferase, partial [Lysobacterales bacterium]
MIGIFGGTFDPVHFGHLRAADEARELLSLADFRLLPAGNPPHRSRTFAPAAHRLAMLRLALEGHTDLWADDREARRTGYSYMVDTLAEIRREEGDVPVLLIIGQDAANTLDSWHEWRKLFNLAHIVIMRRPESSHDYSGALLRQVQQRLITDPGHLRESSSGMVLPLELTQLAISSSHIRQQIGSGKSVRFLMPENVIHYIY